MKLHVISYLGAAQLAYWGDKVMGQHTLTPSIDGHAHLELKFGPHLGYWLHCCQMMYLQEKKEVFDCHDN